MAIVISGKTECPVCNAVIAEPDDLVATSAFIEDASHPLSQYSDAAMHRACFMSWGRRREFIDLFNKFWSSRYRGIRLMHDDGSIEEKDPR